MKLKSLFGFLKKPKFWMPSSLVLGAGAIVLATVLVMNTFFSAAPVINNSGADSTPYVEEEKSEESENHQEESGGQNSNQNSNKPSQNGENINSTPTAQDPQGGVQNVPYGYIDDVDSNDIASIGTKVTITLFGADSGGVFADSMSNFAKASHNAVPDKTPYTKFLGFVKKCDNLGKNVSLEFAGTGSSAYQKYCRKYPDMQLSTGDCLISMESGGKQRAANFSFSDVYTVTKINQSAQYTVSNNSIEAEFLSALKFAGGVRNKNVTVFAVGEDYQIMMPATGNSLMTVKVGDRIYSDNSNGILRSDVAVHRVVVPGEVLDEAKSYTVIERDMRDRKAYFPVVGNIEAESFKFRPVSSSGEVRAYYISDTHERVAMPVDSAKKFGSIDLLVLGGDIPDDSSKLENILTGYEISGSVAKGEIPVIWSRGNHETRGAESENIADYIPAKDGKLYYTVRLGSIWAVVLDCGEDKADNHAEYGGTVDCTQYRKAQTEFLKRVIKNADDEYEAEGVKYRIVISHVPFTDVNGTDADISAEWTRLIAQNIYPDTMLSGHYHYTSVVSSNRYLRENLPEFSVLIGSKYDVLTFTGTGIIFSGKNIDAEFINSSSGKVGGGKLK